MAFQPAPGVMRAVMEYLVSGQTMVNVLHVHSDEEIGAGSCEDLAAGLVDWWLNNLQPYVSTDVSLVNVIVRDLSTEFGAFFEHPGSLPAAGELASPVMPGNVTPVVSWSSGLTGRSTRGRTYHIGISETQCVGNLLSGAAQIALEAGYVALIEHVQEVNPEWDLVVLSRVQDGVPLAEAIGYGIINAGIDLALDSQRRRLSGRGT